MSRENEVVVPDEDALDGGVSDEGDALDGGVSDGADDEDALDEGVPDGADDEDALDVDAFAWDTWDGEEYGAFPDAMRPWLERVGSHFSEQTKKSAEEKEYAERVYAALVEGQEDPRLVEYQDTIRRLQEEMTGKQADYQKAQEVAERIAEQETDRYLKWVDTSRGDTFAKIEKEQGEAGLAGISSLLNTGLDLHDAIDVVAMGPAALKAAQELVHKVTDAGTLLELVRARTVPKPPPAPVPVPPPRPAAGITAGATRTSRPVPVEEQRTRVRDGDWDAAITRAVSRAFQKKVR
jgi:hypothetical protein